MRFRKVKTWFLLGYLGLLLNLGPSMHHAHCFGLHHQESSSTGAVIPGLASDAACGCDCHQHHDTSDQDSDCSVYGDHDCLLCKFFEECNFVITVFQLDEGHSSLSLLGRLTPVCPTTYAVLTTARGPPLA